MITPEELADLKRMESEANAPEPSRKDMVQWNCWAVAHSVYMHALESAAPRLIAAAESNTALVERVRVLTEALKPFAYEFAADCRDDELVLIAEAETGDYCCMISDFRRARALLANTEAQGE